MDLVSSIIADLIGVLIVMLVWNWTFVPMTSVVAINFWQALGVMVIFRACQRNDYKKGGS